MYYLRLRFCEAAMSWSLISDRICRRRIQTEKKAKVSAAVWGAESIYFFAAIATILHQDDLTNRMNSTRTI